MRKIYIYILELCDGTHYTGITNNIQRRLQEHSTGRSISTKFRLPLKLIYLRTATDRKTARRIEVRIKGIGARRFLRMKSTIQAIKSMPN